MLHVRYVIVCFRWNNDRTKTEMPPFSRNFHHWLHWKLSTSSAASDENFIKTNTFPFQCTLSIVTSSHTTQKRTDPFNAIIYWKRNSGVSVTPSLMTRFMGPTRGPSGADRTQVGPMNFVIWDSQPVVWWIESISDATRPGTSMKYSIEYGIVEQLSICLCWEVHCTTHCEPCASLCVFIVLCFTSFALCQKLTKLR